LGKIKFLFRVDAGQQIGLGHFYRSVSLAQYLVREGHEVFFVNKKSNFWVNVNLHFDFKSYYLENTNELEIITNKKIDVLYVDGQIIYSQKYILELKKLCKVIFFQNLTKSRVFADIYISPSIDHDNLFFSKFSNSTKVFYGLEYFLFNSRILKLLKNKNKSIKQNIGIIAGGSDPKNCLFKIFKLINFEKYPNHTFTFYYGVDNIGNTKKISDFIKCPKNKHNNVKLENFDHVKILNNNILISAFGVSTYEFLAFGKPIISYAHSSKNLHSLNNFEVKTKSLINVGLISCLSKDILNKHINKLLIDNVFNNKLRKKAKSTINFNGIEKVAKILLNE
jgi:spore coat polysaccharide biosynthesis predicted glycosyltransferase SpsG